METILPKKLYEEVLYYYETIKNSENSKYIVPKSLPVLFFGDLNKYFKSDLKVITVGKNPSGHEFLSDVNRFPSYRKTPYSLELSLSEYFKKNPYSSWFKHYNIYLEEFGYSFYNKPGYNKVIHTDIGSPLSTDPTWRKLEKENKSLTEELFKDGFEIWKTLISELLPDIIIMCCPLQMEMKETVFKELKLEKIDTIHTITNKKDSTELRQIPFELTYNQIVVNGFKTKLVFGGISRINPFGIIGNDNIRLLGRKTETFLNRTF